MIDVYGLKNCDTCRKALKWLKENDVGHNFRDVRRDGFDAKSLRGWVDAAGWETLLNRRGTTWRGLSEADRDGVDAEKAVTLMRDNPALIKRPVFDLGQGSVVVGFGPKEQKDLAARLSI